MKQHDHHALRHALPTHPSLSELPPAIQRLLACRWQRLEKEFAPEQFPRTLEGLCRRISRAPPAAIMRGKKCQRFLLGFLPA